MEQEYLTEKYKKYYSVEKKRKFLPFLLLVVFIISGWLIYKNYNIFFWYFQKNKHSYFENKIDSIQEKIYQNQNINLIKEKNFNNKKSTEIYSGIMKLKKELEKTMKKNSIDSNLNFYKGKVLWLEFLYSTREIQHPYSELVFYTIIQKNIIKEQVCSSCIEEAIIYIRRALVLQLYSQYKIEAKLLLANLYFWLDTYRWKKAYQIIIDLSKNYEKILGEKSKYYAKDRISNLYSIIFPNFPTNWGKLSTFFTEEISIHFLKGCQYFVQKNTPNAYFYLQKVLKLTNKKILAFQNSSQTTFNNNKLSFAKKQKNEQSPYESFLYNYRNNALYMLGLLYKGFYKKDIQLSYYSLIDLDFFIPKNYWFLEEIYNLYVFTNKKNIATTIFNQYRNYNKR